MAMIQRFFGGLPMPNYSKMVRTYCTVAAGMRSAYDGQFRILGPPELYGTQPSCPSSNDNNNNNNNNNNIGVNNVKEEEEATPTSSSTGNPFMDAMMTSYNSYYGVPPGMGYTENHSPTYLTSGNPCLDYFFHVVPSTPAGEVTKRLESAWDQDALTALKLVCNLRGVRGTGKSDRKGFYTSAMWIHQHHPKTLAGNVEPIADFGYFKDLLEILYQLVLGSERDPRLGRMYSVYGAAEPAPVKYKSGEERRLEAARNALTKYNDDPNYRLLHDKVSQFFADYLKSDMEKLRSGNCNSLSLAAKWCPSLDSSFDRYTLMCESIARRLFPLDEYPGTEESHYAYRIRDRLRKEVLVPLRRALKLPEVYICAHEWSSIDYSRVASIAMKNYTDLFHKHDQERFQSFLKKVEKGEAKIAAGALLPHQIVNKVRHTGDEVAELQWKRMVENLSASGNLKNCLAICDVSGSMYGEPLDVSVALGMLISELSEEPWKGKLITFSESPQFQVIKGETLSSKINCIERLQWDMNTNFQKVFDRILEVAVEGKLTEDDMIKRLFVFSDMEFDQASSNNWETDYQAIVRKFNEKGFTRVPEIVFWNLRNSSATPVPSHQPGVAMVSGFSKNLIKVFIQDDGCLNPVKTMEAAISGKEYQKLVVLD